MNVICVDDERMILQHTVDMCRGLPRVTDVKGFHTAKETLEYLKNHTADIAILDINMPGVNGLTLAKEIQQRYPAMGVIFLTGFEQYAVDAFTLHPAGYIVKPLSIERLSEELDHASKRKERLITRKAGIRTFGDFEVRVEGTAVSFPRSKAKELLAYLVDRQGSSITRADASALFWEDMPYDRSRQKQIDVFIRSLRTTLNRYEIGDIFELQGGAMRICPERIDCDFYHLLEGDKEATAAYRDDYLISYDWAEDTRERIAEVLSQR